jgi:hypothetical protein
MTATSSAGLRPAALAINDAELDPSALLERSGAFGQRRGMDEYVLAVVRGKEAEALVHVVPPDLAGRHGCPFSHPAPEWAQGTRLDGSEDSRAPRVAPWHPQAPWVIDCSASEPW